jgi:UDP-N-acetylmuramoyl-L-alanyl-D-glutamate--2,6-diaminopimelate ligase
MRQLKDYLDVIKPLEVVGEGNPDIGTIVFDSRKAIWGSLFIALRGSNVDGHDFISKAVEAGCEAVLCEILPEKLTTGITFIKVADTSEALGLLAAFHHGNPSRELRVVGVTGTNGKTTVATLLHRLALDLGYKAGLCSTVANFINEDRFEATHTTPDALTLQGLLRQMVDAGCEYCFMEVSSHAVVQKRITGIEFDGGIFTNLTHDHLDYHLTFDAYIKAKKGFFDTLGKKAFAIVNADDKNGSVMLQNCNASKYTYSQREMADFRVKVVESLFEGMHLEINNKEMWTPFIGRFNASNLISVYGAAILLGWETETVLTSLSKLTPVDGRFETIRSSNGVTAVVDYAHTPDALTNVLEALNQIRQSGNELITVVGAGGNRDPFKRPVMAAEAVKASSRVILTSDNPRFEDPEIIIQQMMEGVQFKDRIKVLCITNRREAIRTACTMARRGDVVLVAGKGHETYQEVKGERTHFDDREIIKEVFEQL